MNRRGMGRNYGRNVPIMRPADNTPSTNKYDYVRDTESAKHFRNDAVSRGTARNNNSYNFVMPMHQDHNFNYRNPSRPIEHLQYAQGRKQQQQQPFTESRSETIEELIDLSGSVDGDLKTSDIKKYIDSQHLSSEEVEESDMEITQMIRNAGMGPSVDRPLMFSNVPRYSAAISRKGFSINRNGNCIIPVLYDEAYFKMRPAYE